MRLSDNVLLRIAAFSMVVALFFQNVTVASGDYRLALANGLAGMLVADGCCLVVWRRGGDLKWCMLAVVPPSAFIVFDFLGRAPGTWQRFF